MAMYDRPEDTIVALSCGLGFIQRCAGESLDALLARAAHVLGHRILWAVYAALSPPAVPIGSSPPIPVTPIDLAGIGRQATVAELRRWGVLPQP